MWVSRLEGWDETTKERLYQTRSDLLLEALESGTAIMPWDALADRIRMVAAFSLAQEGYFELNPDDSETLRLTATGLQFARGARALSKG